VRLPRQAMTLARGAKDKEHAPASQQYCHCRGGIDIGKHVPGRPLLAACSDSTVSAVAIATAKLLLKGGVVAVRVFPSITNVTARSVPVQSWCQDVSSRLRRRNIRTTGPAL
jgi:hypothetical protein